jgi:probable HAF family extracellular repeat protein
MKKFLRTAEAVNASALFAIAGLVAVMGLAAPALAQDVFPFADGPDGIDGPGGGDEWEDVALIAPVYQLQEVGRLGGTESYATAISDNGWVVGGGPPRQRPLASHPHAGRRRREAIASLPGLDYSGAFSVNINGDVVGVASTSASLYGSTSQPWVFRNGQTIDLDPFDRGVYAAASAINDGGIVVGTTSFVGSGSVEGFRSVGGGIASLQVLSAIAVASPTAWASTSKAPSSGTPPLPATAATTAQVVFPSSGGPAIDLGTLGGVDGQAQAINSFGDIVGYSELSSRQNRATLWTSSGPQNLGTLAGGQLRP